MNNSETSERRWVPSARKSIHDHKACIFANYSKMGRYGLKTRPAGEKNNEESDRDQGVDEVDNVMSKMASQSSPQKFRKCHKNRRNSYNAYDNHVESDSDSDVLAKSLPANMPSYYCSDEFPHRSLPTDYYNVHNNSSHSSIPALNGSRNYTHESIEERSSDRIEELREQTKKYPSSNKYKKVLLTFIALLCLVAGIYIEVISTHLNSNSVYYDDLKLNEELDIIKDKYHISDHSILELQNGISTISERNDSGSFIFVYNSKSIKFDPLQFNNFLEDITITTAKYLRNSSRSTEPTIVQSSQLTMKTHSELMNKYRNEVAKTGVMLVKDVDKIPSSLAMAFHYFCDEYNPLVAKTAIFFTLNLDTCSNSEKKSTYVNVENCLANKWDAIPKDSIKPLLARIVNVIVDLS